MVHLWVWPTSVAEMREDGRAFGVLYRPQLHTCDRRYEWLGHADLRVQTLLTNGS